jgi:hypothetical protein
MILKVLLVIYSAVALAVQIVEDSKDGLTPTEAKAAALKAAREIIVNALGAFPWWLPEMILAYLVDVLVDILNKKGVFEHEGGTDAGAAARALGSYLNQP